jgi:sec-independent protein translocase protein TatA
MYGFGHLWELVVVLLIALIFFGPKRLPELASGLGKSIREFRKSTSEIEDQITGETTTPPPSAEQYHTAGDGASTAHSAAPHAATSAPRDTEATHT